MLQVYYETEAIQVSYDEERQLGVGEWKGFASSDELRHTAMNALDFINENGITRWLADRRKMKAIRQQDQQWTVDVFIPKVLKSPLRRLANVVSEDIFNKMAVEDIFLRSGGLGNIAFRDFDKVEEALEWLQQPFDNETPTTGNGNGMKRE